MTFREFIADLLILSLDLFDVLLQRCCRPKLLSFEAKHAHLEGLLLVENMRAGRCRVRGVVDTKVFQECPDLGALRQQGLQEALDHRFVLAQKKGKPKKQLQQYPHTCIHGPYTRASTWDFLPSEDCAAPATSLVLKAVTWLKALGSSYVSSSTWAQKRLITQEGWGEWLTTEYASLIRS